MSYRVVSRSHNASSFASPTVVTSLTQPRPRPGPHRSRAEIHQLEKGKKNIHLFHAAWQSATNLHFLDLRPRLHVSNNWSSRYISWLWDAVCCQPASLPVWVQPKCSFRALVWNRLLLFLVGFNYFEKELNKNILKYHFSMELKKIKFMRKHEIWEILNIVNCTKVIHKLQVGLFYDLKIYSKKKKNWNVKTYELVSKIVKNKFQLVRTW